MYKNSNKDLIYKLGLILIFVGVIIILSLLADLFLQDVKYYKDEIIKIKEDLNFGSESDTLYLEEVLTQLTHSLHVTQAIVASLIIAIFGIGFVTFYHTDKAFKIFENDRIGFSSESSLE